MTLLADPQPICQSALESQMGAHIIYPTTQHPAVPGFLHAEAAWCVNSPLPNAKVEQRCQATSFVLHSETLPPQLFLKAT
ncbi:hypothetical protein E2C01_075042 [Portunus trituberculatus]|uniref:Uncharacterized protein n=1 Tax=Portunus trituberculatus TaxID=210409 RepID=A0A5B7I9P4_PORTR|nr:hypothetical protein [Portunus trituberculatus]